MNNWDKWNDTELPKSYSKLHDGHISGDGYERANLVWNIFK